MRRNKTKRYQSAIEELYKSYDHEYVFRPDRPDVRLFIHHRRKVIQENMEADWGADKVIQVFKDWSDDLW